MRKVTVNLNEMGRVNSFVNTASTFISDIDAIRGHYVIDGKSLMGLLSLDLSKPLDVTIHSDNEEELQRFELEMEKYK
jgi:phosphotransferase system HPr-like phosphotransfer protein